MTRCAAMPTVRCRRLTIITGTTADRSAHAIKPVSSPRGMHRRPRRPRNLHPARDRGDGGHRARAGRRAIRLRRASDRDRLVLRAADTCAADESSPYGQSDITQFGAPPQKFINFPDLGKMAKVCLLIALPCGALARERVHASSLEDAARVERISWPGRRRCACFEKQSKKIKRSLRSRGTFRNPAAGDLSWTPKMRQLAKVEPCP
jgi:hypothetical protein